MKKLIFATLSVLYLAMGSFAQAGTLSEGVVGLKLGMTSQEADAVLGKLTPKAASKLSCEADSELGPNYEMCNVVLPGATYRNLPVAGVSLEFDAKHLQSVGVFFVKSQDAQVQKTRSASLTSFYTGRLGKPDSPHRSPEWTMDDGSVLGLISNSKQEAVMLMEREHYALLGKMARKSDAQKADI